MSDKIPEINLQLTTKVIKGGTTKKLTVRNMFYVGIIGKIKTIFYWLIYHSKTKTFKEHLNSPVTWSYEIGDIYYNADIDAEKELTDLLNKAPDGLNS